MVLAISGHDQSPAIGSQDDEESITSQHCRNHHLLHALRLLRLRSLRRPIPRNCHMWQMTWRQQGDNKAAAHVACMED
ncbi:unnamed protein product [Linum trigynum]|uniref:Uncharacterized protein n=1 Tax=Linum trigynum TaxID=586398 RepID=A0AAV2ELE1_9ROSI